MEIFKNTNFDFLGKKWPFIGLSLVLTAAGLVSLMSKGGPKYGIDFQGGANVYVRFSQEPPVDKIRSALSQRIKGEISVQQVTTGPEVLIGSEIKSEQELNANRQAIIDTLHANFANTQGKLDLNNANERDLVERLREPLTKANIFLSDPQLEDLGKAIHGYRTSHGGIVKAYDELARLPGVTPQILDILKQETALAPFTILSTEVVGPKIGADLRRQAILATLYALGGMLVYIAFRFETIYGVAAVIAVFHDTIITVGLFSLFNKDISLTVVAALLTLVGYSMNDTIVVFDRIRENLKIMRREKFEGLVNISINQTLSRTILTSGLTFLTAVSLWIFGGQVLNGFSFALVVGIIVGTYSSIFIASPILVFWQGFVDARKKGKTAQVAAAPPIKQQPGKKAVRG
jgi:preprotein translocase subunit SecF